MGDNGMRDDLLQLLLEYAAEAGRLGQAFAGSQHMHPTDLNALLAVMRADHASVPVTPGRLGHHLGLSSGATTAVIDRLERAGHVHRVRDERDRRRVTLHFGEAASAVGSAYLGPLGRRMDRMLAAYSSAELSVVRRFLAETNEVMRHRRRDVQTSG
jgi:DNA-binding MarR family transcriptional regulator